MILRRRLSFVIVAAQVKQELLQVHGIVIPANRIPSTQPTKALEISSGWHPDTSRLRSYPEPCFDISNETKLFWKAAGRDVGGGECVGKVAWISNWPVSSVTQLVKMFCSRQTSVSTVNQLAGKLAAHATQKNIDNFFFLKECLLLVTCTQWWRRRHIQGWIHWWCIKMDGASYFKKEGNAEVPKNCIHGLASRVEKCSLQKDKKTT